ncbi:phosphoglucomutase/phosphomannomutase, alpha/beta/alpha domain I, partial [Oesophagostomum dentatum]
MALTPEAKADLAKKAEDWLAWDKNEKTRTVIAKLYEEKNFPELATRLNGRLLFGTAGIRIRQDAGWTRLNDLTVINITHGFVKHILASIGGKKKAGIAVGYDGRHNSKRYSELIANVFIRNGFPVYLFSAVTPTPVV